jgi:hypothetical protein
MHLIWQRSYLNHVFEKMGLAYAPRPLPSSEASRAVREKQKAKVSKKSAAKKAKTGPVQATPSKAVPPPSMMGPLRKVNVVKVVRLRAKPGPQSTSEIELALVKSVGVSKKICLLDVPASSHGVHDEGPAMVHGGEHATHVVSFDNLGHDSSPGVRKTPSTKRTREKHPAPPPSLSSWFLHCICALF